MLSRFPQPGKGILLPEKDKLGVWLCNGKELPEKALLGIMARLGKKAKRFFRISRISRKQGEHKRQALVATHPGDEGHCRATAFYVLPAYERCGKSGRIALLSFRGGP